MTRYKRIFLWVLSSFVALILLYVQSVVLNRISFSNVHPYLLPFVAAMTAIYLPRRDSAIFAFYFGFLCDMLSIGPIPCFYLLVFTLCAFLVGLFTHQFIAPSLFCTVLMCALSLFLTDLFILFFLSFRQEITLLSAANLFLAEFLYSIPFSLLFHLLYTGIKRFSDKL